MLGFFDSGLGGLTVLKEIIKLLPEYSFVYLGDNKRTPYGTKTQKQIFQFTLQGVEFLFSRGAKLVILTCNTSSSSALRKIQRQILPKKYPDKKVLGIIIPTAEEIHKYTKTKKIGLMATPATVVSKAYLKEIKKVSPEIKIFQEACPLLVSMIEKGRIKDSIIKMYLKKLFSHEKKIDTLLLGCTHYAIIEKNIRKLLPPGVKLVSQGKIIAKKLKDYLKRHPEIDNSLAKNKKRNFYTTVEPKKVEKFSKIFFGKKINFQKVDLKNL